MKRLTVWTICGIVLLLTACAAISKAQGVTRPEGLGESINLVTDGLLVIDNNGAVRRVNTREVMRQDGPQTITNDAVQLVEKLADGSYIVRINGFDFRAFNADKVTELQERKIRGEACDKALALSDQENGLLKQQNAVQAGQINTLTTLAEFLAKNGGVKKDSVLRQLGELAWPVVLGLLSKR